MKKLNQDDIDKEILKSNKKIKEEIDQKKIEKTKETNAEIRICPKCNKRDLIIISKDDVFINFKCNNCGNTIVCVNEDNIMI